MQLVFFDVETSGLDDKKHEIVQFAAAATQLRDGKPVIVDELELKLHFDVSKASAKALEVNSYSEQVWREEAVDAQDAVKAISQFLNRHKHVKMMSKRTNNAYHVAALAGHNADRFDSGFLHQLYRKFDAFRPTTMYAYDTVQLARWYFHRRSQINWPEDFKLTTLCKYFNIDMKGEAHDALVDVRANVELYAKLEEVA